MSDQWAGQMGWNIRVVINKYKNSLGGKYMVIAIGNKNIAHLALEEKNWYWGGEKMGTDEYLAVNEVLKRLGYSE